MLTASHSFTASSSLGVDVMMGPKKAGPPASPQDRIGVPTLPPVRSIASSVEACNSASYAVSSAASSRSAGRLTAAKMLGRSAKTVWWCSLMASDMASPSTGASTCGAVSHIWLPIAS